jgi:hypothetical protein
MEGSGKDITITATIKLTEDVGVFGLDKGMFGETIYSRRIIIYLVVTNETDGLLAELPVTPIFARISSNLECFCVEFKTQAQV